MVVVEDHQEWEPSMNEITTIGLDLAKNVFQVHGADATGATVNPHMRHYRDLGSELAIRLASGWG